MARVLYEDKDYRVVFKNVREHYDDTSITQGSTASLWEPVHRLDFETSGLLLCAAPSLVASTRALFQEPGRIRKIYWAGASQELPESFLHGRAIHGFIGSRYRASKKVRYGFDEREFKGWHSIRPASHIVRPHEGTIPQFQGIPYEVELLTGARHQIRAFFASQDASLRGDPLYGDPDDTSPRLELHSWKLSFEHPENPGHQLSFECPLE